ARQEHEIEAILDLVDAVFHGDPGHGLVTPLESVLLSEVDGLGSPPGGKAQGGIFRRGLAPLAPARGSVRQLDANRGTQLRAAGFLSSRYRTTGGPRRVPGSRLHRINRPPAGRADATLD